MVRINVLGYKGYYALSHIAGSYYSLIDEVIIARDKNVQNDYFEEISAFCKLKGIKYYERNNEPPCHAKYQVLIGWRWLVNDKTTLIVFHDSILPKYRGFNPLVSALINGEKHIGVTCLFGTNEYDKGEIIGQKKIEISYPIKIEAAINLVSPLYADLLNSFFASHIANNITSTAQQEADASYSLWRDEEDYSICWSWSAEKIKRFVDAVGFPYTGAKAKLKDCLLRIFDVEITGDVKIENREPGKVIFKDERGLVIVCGQGLIAIKTFFYEDGTIFDYTKSFRLKFT